MSTIQIYKTNDRDYQWHGGFGDILESHENDLVEGDVRCICNNIFYVSFVYKRIFKKNIVRWSIKDVSADKIKQIKQEMFGLM
jgi:hypothetical protein